MSRGIEPPLEKHHVVSLPEQVGNRRSSVPLDERVVFEGWQHAPVEHAAQEHASLWEPRISLVENHAPCREAIDVGSRGVPGVSVGAYSIRLYVVDRHYDDVWGRLHSSCGTRLLREFSVQCELRFQLWLVRSVVVRGPVPVQSSCHVPAAGGLRVDEIRQHVAVADDQHAAERSAPPSSVAPRRGLVAGCHRATKIAPKPAKQSKAVRAKKTCSGSYSSGSTTWFTVSEMPPRVTSKTK